jgi:FAD/FMN-containing dehydrogenase
MINLKSWGLFPKIKNKAISLTNLDLVKKFSKSKSVIPYGNGRSYGDSALNPNIIYCRPKNELIEFNKENGFIHCEAGILLSEIIEETIPYGWFLHTTPGTKFITLGGAIASDIHGKNHHSYGCFSECILEFNLLIGDKIYNVKRGDKLFLSTCGGMGLTGVILDVKFNLKKISSSNINQILVCTKNLTETFDAFEKYSKYTYSVAWIDCLSSGKNLGRSVINIGEFANDKIYSLSKKNKINIPFYFPSFILNHYTVKIFNFLYYNLNSINKRKSKVSYDTFFYPLDSILNWNRIYGSNGFTQYQFIFPKRTSFEAIKLILNKISKTRMGSFLAVLKLYGKSNSNYLSFPMEGYSLAIDFKISKNLFPFLDELDKIVVKYSGRIYLSKDSRMKTDVFEKGYPELKKFKKIRKEMNLNKMYNSVQSLRLDL